jgi:hypothetical protein
VTLISLDELEAELKGSKVDTHYVLDIKEFCKQFSGKEKFINLYFKYTTDNCDFSVSSKYFRDVISSIYVTYTVGKYSYVDFDQVL